MKNRRSFTYLISLRHKNVRFVCFSKGKRKLEKKQEKTKRPPLGVIIFHGASQSALAPERRCVTKYEAAVAR